MSTPFPAFDVARSAQTDALTLVGLSVTYRVRGREREVLHDVSLRIRRGEAYGLVGESGCGKSTVALAVARYLPRNGKLKSGMISIGGHDLLAMNPAQLRQLRASAVSMVYQDPGRALNPSLTIGRQVSESFEAAGAAPGEAREQARQMLQRVRIAAPERVMRSYAHQLSGGMQQRVVIAMALATRPALLILDEPTTGLDATVEAEVLDLIAQLRRELSMAILFISHNLAVIGRMCDRVGVLYAGKLVEEGTVRDVFARPRHPYTVGLLRCLPRLGMRKNAGRLETIPGAPPAPGQVVAGCIYAERCRLADDRCRTVAPPPYRIGATPGANSGEQMARCHYHERAAALPPIKEDEDDSATSSIARPAPRAGAKPDGRPATLRAHRLSKTFYVDGQALQVVVDVSLELRPGETLGLVGESGSGKTTLAKLLLGLIAPDPGGRIELDGAVLPGRVTQRTPQQIKALQSVFQNPDAALNRAHSVRQLVGRPLKKLAGLSGPACDSRLAALLAAVRLPKRYLGVRTRQLSGGLKQRVAIARAFAGEPRVVVCDEPTSSLDVSVQAAILNLLADLQSEREVSYLFISHDLAVVRYLSDRIGVLYLGRLMEIGTAEQVFGGPRHPYTEALLSSMPALALEDGGEHGRAHENPGGAAGAIGTPRIRLSGEIPSAAKPPSGCVFHTRCHRKLGALCEQTVPPLLPAGNGHVIRCHIPAPELAVLQNGDQA